MLGLKWNHVTDVMIQVENGPDFELTKDTPNLASQGRYGVFYVV